MVCLLVLGIGFGITVISDICILVYGIAMLMRTVQRRGVTLCGHPIIDLLSLLECGHWVISSLGTLWVVL